MKRVTMQQIAEQAGVSRTTVSFVLNNKPGTNIPDSTRERILKIAQGLGYFHPMRDRSISMVIRSPYEKVAQASFLIEVMRAFAAVVDPLGYQVNLLEVSDVQSFDYRDVVRRHRCAGLLVFNMLTEEGEALKSVADAGTPVITLGQSNVEGISSADVDNVRAAYNAVRYLLELGHRRIATIPYAPPNHLVSAHRLLGYRQAMTEAGLPVDENLIVPAVFTSESGASAVRTLLQNADELPTAIFVGSDVVALGVMDAIKAEGLSIPDDIALIGFDDIPLVRYVTPSLTTVRRPALEIGRSAAEMMMAYLRDGATVPAKSILLESHIVERESTVPRRSASKNGKK